MDENIDKQKRLAQYNLCKSLIELLGTEQATADLHRLNRRHKHDKMFKSDDEIDSLIKEVLNNPDIIIKNPTPKTEKDYIAAKQRLDNEPHKMGDVGLSNKDGTSRIFHANKKAKRNFNKYIKIAADGGAVRSPHTPSQLSWMGGNEKSSGANALSSTAQGGIISQPKPQSQIDSKESKIAEMKEKVKNAINGDKTQINKDKSLDIDK